MYCGTVDSSSERKSIQSTLSNFQKRRQMASHSVSLPSFVLGETSSFRSCQTAQARDTRRANAAESVEIQKLLLSCFCPQSWVGASIGLAILQIQGSRRTGYPRTQRESATGQSSNQQFPGQYYPFRTNSSCLRFSQLVQKALFARTMAKSNFAHLTNRVVGFASKIAKDRQSQCAQVASSLCTSEIVSTSCKKNRTITDSVKFHEFVENALLCLVDNIIKSPRFTVFSGSYLHSFNISSHHASEKSDIMVLLLTKTDLTTSNLLLNNPVELKIHRSF